MTECADLQHLFVEKSIVYYNYSTGSDELFEIFIPVEKGLQTQTSWVLIDSL